MAKNPDVRGALIDALGPIKDDRVAVYLSSGLDSLACALTLRDLGKRVTAYTFHLEGRDSQDLSHARRNAETFGFAFRAFPLDASVNRLVDYIQQVKSGYGLRKKAELECVWPFWETIGLIEERVVVTGHAADGYFGVSKRAILHYKNRLDEFRANYFGKTDVAQTKTLGRLFADCDCTGVFPFVTDRMFAEFEGTTWEQLNRPKQKQTIIDAFPKDFARIKVFPHTNLQLGDSGIAKAFEALLESPFNRRGSRAVIGVYNDL